MTMTAGALRRATPRRYRPGRVRPRLVGFLVIFGLLFGSIVLRVGLVQTTQASTFVSDGEVARRRVIDLPAGRGTIFDRSGIELAMTVPATTIWADPRVMSADEKAAVLSQLTPLLGLDQTQVEGIARQFNTPDEQFVYIKRQIDDTLAEQVRALKLSGVHLVAEFRRYNPADNLAVSVIGSTNPDGEGSTGLEAQYDKVLTGTKGSIVREANGKGLTIPDGKNITTPPTPGNDIVVTIDSKLQYEVDSLLIDRVTETGAQGGIVVVMDTQTGDLLTMSNVRVDPKTGRAVISNANHALVDTYEPGSVAKIISASAALEEGTSDLTQTWSIPRSVLSQVEGSDSVGYKVDDRIITDAENHEAKSMSLPDIIAHSSNIGTVKLAQSVGSAKIDQYFRSFGFGKTTGLGFPNETPGLMLPFEKTPKATRATMTFGQGIGVTAVQLVAAMNTIANQGEYVAPRLVRSIIDKQGVEQPAEAAAAHQVIRPDTAAKMNGVLQGVVCFGTASEEHAADIPGYAVAGKTGTAYKAQNIKGKADGYQDKFGNYHFVSSFAGFAPAENPRVTILVSLDDPTKGDFKYGRSGAAPLFAKVGAEALRTLKVAPSPPEAFCDAKK